MRSWDDQQEQRKLNDFEKSRRNLLLVPVSESGGMEAQLRIDELETEVESTPRRRGPLQEASGPVPDR